ncbi:MAG: DUF1707 domain-containing protein, partial [Actinomycetota bacterium]|nr:DUF1707 domain-containing protein [Actinomycetota bacterium]
MHDELRASDHERDEVVDLLRRHCADGRLSLDELDGRSHHALDELDDRSHHALTARTRGELDGLTR